MDIKLITSMRQQGFLDVMSSLISEMKRYLITPEILFEKANALTDNKTLKNKLDCTFKRIGEISFLRRRKWLYRQRGRPFLSCQPYRKRHRI